MFGPRGLGLTKEKNRDAEMLSQRIVLIIVARITSLQVNCDMNSRGDCVQHPVRQVLLLG